MPKKHPIVWVTAYDAWSAALAQEAGVDAILMGDSVANVLLGYAATKELTLAETLHHLRATLRGAGRVPVIADAPWALTCLPPTQAVRVAREYIRAGAKSVKIEWSPGGIKLAQALAKARVPFVGHIGLTPQTLTPRQWKKNGLTFAMGNILEHQARRFEALGAETLVLECVPSAIAERITGALKIPTIGIGSGPDCSGQVLVFHDLTGLSPETFKPRFIRRFANARRNCLKALSDYARAVRSRSFPLARHSYKLSDQPNRRRAAR